MITKMITNTDKKIGSPSNNMPKKYEKRKKKTIANLVALHANVVTKLIDLKTFIQLNVKIYALQDLKYHALK